MLVMPGKGNFSTPGNMGYSFDSYIAQTAPAYEEYAPLQKTSLSVFYQNMQFPHVYLVTYP